MMHNHLNIPKGSPLIPIFSTLSSSLHLHSSAAKGHHHAVHQTLPRSTPYPLSTYFRHQHTSSHTVLIHSLHVTKPSQYSLIPSTRKLPPYSSSSKQLFSLNSIRSWYSNNTSQTLHLLNWLSFSQYFSFPMPLPRASWSKYCFKTNNSSINGTASE